MAQASTVFRQALRELRASAVQPGKLNRPLAANFRTVIETQRAAGQYNDVENAIIFMRSQRIHKELLERYNPTGNYTADERLRATTRRVGLEMPKVYDPEAN
ncbi:hypothetical protein FB45DRAFT_411078 [Roridomyces roridus]|uniref:Complex 1 LYR protein n=1 Tax=Roridomyces roridus TaxID=1738132 RepID=A0AAD7C483_9AGAR|nr:hypothetical protein FB45DRAFT_411078 [Roridomyces roridus]